MEQHQSIEIRQPRTDDRVLWDICEGTLAYQAVLVAHDLKLFSILAERSRTLAEVCEALKIVRRPAEALLTVCTALRLVQLEEGCYSLTPVAEDYLVESSPTYFGGLLDFAMIQNRNLYSFDSLKQAVLTNRAQVYGGEELFKSHEEQAALARSFTHFMHSHSIAPALAWPDTVDLTNHRVMLDVGGGSGAHAIGALRKWPDLRAIVFDLPPVCEVANEYIRRYSLQTRIGTHTGDMWNDPFPPADLHFYADIYHDWPPEKCRFLTQKSFASLQPGGRIIIHEVLFNDERTGPLAAAGHSIAMLLWTEGQQFSGRELSTMLSEAGFTAIAVKSTFGYCSIVTGQKPS